MLTAPTYAADHDPLDAVLAAIHTLVPAAERYGHDEDEDRHYQLHELQAARAIAAELAAYTEQHVDQARGLNASWQEIGDALGISRQAAHERYRTS